MLIVLLLAALLVVFILPGYVTEPWFADESIQDSNVPDSLSVEISPSKTAEKTKYRQDSQSLLAEIIIVRDRLESRQVKLWAEVDYQLALNEIASGDEQYSYGNYAASLDSYRQVLNKLNALEQLGQEKLANALAGGNEAIESLKLNVASASSAMATAIAPDMQEVRVLATRAETLPRLAIQMEKGDQAHAAGQLTAAKEAYQVAVDLDPLHQKAAKSLSKIKTEIIESNFRKYMSRGYAALDNGDFDMARTEFEQAGKIYGGNTAVSQALAQVENRKSQSWVSGQLGRAADLEIGEEWQQAQSVYESLLEQDSTLTEVKVKLIPAKVRSDLDQRITMVLDDPLRLSEPSFYRKASRALDDARGIPNPGDRLSGQVTALEKLLKAALLPVKVVFQSDNLTKVTLFQVVELGRFTQTSLQLKPGRYVAAGTRQGFRDVRVEFTVSGEPLGEPIVVRCVEPI
jgi:tetratricopeptide (TPR) repeat protein